MPLVYFFSLDWGWQ